VSAVEATVADCSTRPVQRMRTLVVRTEVVCVAVNTLHAVTAADDDDVECYSHRTGFRPDCSVNVGPSQKFSGDFKDLRYSFLNSEALATRCYIRPEKVVLHQVHV